MTNNIKVKLNTGLQQLDTHLANSNDGITDQSLNFSTLFGDKVRISVTGSDTNASFFESGWHHFYTVYNKLTGDFVVETKIEDISGNVSDFSQFGIVLFDDFPPNANKAYASVHILAGKEYGFNYDSTGDGQLNNWTFGDGEKLSGNVRMTRSGNTITGEHSDDGITWTSLGSFEFTDMPDNVNVGIYVTPSNHNSGGGEVYADFTVKTDYITNELLTKQILTEHDITHNVRFPSLSTISRMFSSADRCYLSVDDLSDTLVNPQTEMLIIDGSDFVFGGVLLQSRDTNTDARIIKDLEFRDWSEFFNTIYVSKKYEFRSLSYILTDLLTEYTNGFIIYIDEDTVVEEIEFDKMTLLQAFTEIEQQHNINWWVDPDKTVYFFKDLLPE